eukprot:TRINITY_DN5472_c0_g1_i1.p1 TRINITY_DN5472_c0_g1~~TRINITY_DN5472_c0_g1_i1.p1  ORF type:complete len:102 (+),score=5.90 TRINITY_DN5472_c0_g1_i1:67-372(+)
MRTFCSKYGHMADAIDVLPRAFTASTTVMQSSAFLGKQGGSKASWLKKTKSAFNTADRRVPIIVADLIATCTTNNKTHAVKDTHKCFASPTRKTLYSVPSW